MTIARVMEGRSADILTCKADMTVRDAVAILAGKKIGALPVMDGDQVVGIFSERDVIYRLHEFGPDACDRKIRDVMTAPAVTVEPDTAVLDALSLMTLRRIRHLPVMLDGKMVGFISIGDLVKYRIEVIQSEAEAMREYIQTA